MLPVVEGRVTKLVAEPLAMATAEIFFDGILWCGEDHGEWVLVEQPLCADDLYSTAVILILPHRVTSVQCRCTLHR